jgi:hypothetical protein
VVGPGFRRAKRYVSKNELEDLFLGYKKSIIKKQI